VVVFASTTRSRSYGYHPHVAYEPASRSGFTWIVGVFSAINRLIPAGAGAQLSAIFFSSRDFLAEVKAPSSRSDLGQVDANGLGPPVSRFSLSHFPLGSTTSKPIGPGIGRMASCADARFADKIPSLVTVGGGNRRTTKIMIGFRFAEVCVTCAGRRSLFCRPFLHPIATTA
jgi:hypothetical protein